MIKLIKIFLLFSFFCFFLFFVNQFLNQKTDFALNRPEQELIIERPLIKKGETNILSYSGVLKWTNYERNLYQLSSLSENKELNVIAEMKINDMFEKQYFDHYSPSGEKIDDLANLMGYDYIGIGENLAMGGFKGDRDLVTGWMNSPGHRANILKPGYRETGIAVKENYFEDEKVWFAVQVFALPSSACPKPDLILLQEINQKKKELNDLFLRITTLKNEIDKTIPKNKNDIKIYNNLVSQYNNLTNSVEILIKDYNEQVNLTNNCIDSYGF